MSQLDQGWCEVVDPGISEAASQLWHSGPALVWAFKIDREHQPVPLTWRVFLQLLLHLAGEILVLSLLMLAALFFSQFFSLNSSMLPYSVILVAFFFSVPKDRGSCSQSFSTIPHSVGMEVPLVTMLLSLWMFSLLFCLLLCRCSVAFSSVHPQEGCSTFRCSLVCSMGVDSRVFLCHLYDFTHTPPLHTHTHTHFYKLSCCCLVPHCFNLKKSLQHFLLGSSSGDAFPQ